MTANFKVDNKKISINHLSRDFKLTILSLALFLLGLILGSFAISLNTDNSCYGLIDYIKSIYIFRCNSTYFLIVLSSFLSSFVYLLLLYLCGASVFGLFFCFFIPLFRGFSIGLIAGCLYRFYALSGIGFFALILLFGLFLSTVVIIISCCDAFKFSLNFFSLLSPITKETLIFSKIKAFTIKFAIYCGILLISSLIDGLMSVCFINYFTL